MTTLPKLPILLYSEYSNNCRALRQMLKDEHLSMFEKICIDSEEIREAILNSEVIEVNNVPCFLQIFPDGTVAKYEAADAFKWVTQFLANKNQSPHVQSHSQSQSGGLPGSSVDSILSGLKSIPQMRAPPLVGLQSRASQDLHLDRMEPPRRGPRRPFEGISSDRDIISGDESSRPVKGEGHENMRSSLPGMGVNVPDGAYEETMQAEEEEYVPRVSVGRGKQSVLIQDLTPAEEEDEQTGPSLDDDPSGMGIMRGEVHIAGGKNPNTGQVQKVASQLGGRGKEKGNSIKALARQMAAAREAEQKTVEVGRQPPLPSGKAKKTALSSL